MPVEGQGGAAGEMSEDQIALQGLIAHLRRENRELSRRLLLANAAAGGGGGSPSSVAGEGDGAGAGVLMDEPDDEPIVELVRALDAVVPTQLRETGRYHRLAEQLVEVQRLWSQKVHRLRAMRTAVLGSEATVATLQEELLATEAAQVTLGQLVKSQAAEVVSLRGAKHSAEQEATEGEAKAQESEARRSEAEALLQLRHSSEAELRTSARSMQRSITDAHTSLDSFVTSQQTRRGRELEQRHEKLGEWEAMLRGVLAQVDASLVSTARRGRASRRGRPAASRCGRRGRAARAAAAVAVAAAAAAAAAARAVARAGWAAAMRRAPPKVRGS